MWQAILPTGALSGRRSDMRRISRASLHDACDTQRKRPLAHVDAIEEGGADLGTERSLQERL